MSFGVMLFLFSSLIMEPARAQGPKVVAGTKATAAPVMPAKAAATPPSTKSSPNAAAPNEAVPAAKSPTSGSPAVTDDGHPAQNPNIPGVPQISDDGMGEGSGLVLKKNTFTYDGNEGRDPFKVFREVPIFVPGQTNTDPKSNGKPELPGFVEKNIRTVLVPSEVVVMGILFKKVDPIALVAVRGVKGLNKLMVNSPIGRNEGKIIEIRKDKIIIEQVKDFDGQKFTEKVELKVREKKN